MSLESFNTAKTFLLTKEIRWLWWQELEHKKAYLGLIFYKFFQCILVESFLFLMEIRGYLQRDLYKSLLYFEFMHLYVK